MKKFTTNIFLLVLCAVFSNIYAADVTVRVQVSDDWTDDVYLYIWGTPNDLIGGWPGQQMTKDADGYFTCTYDNAGVEQAEGILNNNAGQQINLESVIAGGSFELISWSEVNRITLPGDNDVTVKLRVPADWTDDVYLYIWGTPNDLIGGWPGQKMAKDADGYIYYTYDVSSASSATGILNNNSGQQVDLPNGGNALAGGCFELNSWTEIVAIDCNDFTSGVLNNHVSSFVVYPNPTSDFVYLASTEGVESVSIYDSRGMKVNTVTNSVEEINISNLPSGAYFFSISMKDGSQLTKTIIKK